ncbi:uncharacterized protein LOC121366201 [Gigantopelta aegis]|uniref:uncharacterized protein LOC121366201 n=1 Tax=Gigantopelta aegis TaxID=1735272 RepID=UPI001B8873DB|nr:uncharacterized protein LOC121366201 [Gigantopelta aegis]
MENTMKYIALILVMTGLCWCDITGIDTDRVSAGKQAYELMQQRSEMPRYGTCWKNAMVTIQTGCKRLTDDIQSRLALAYLNCFLQVQGRDVYDCDTSQPVHECTTHMKDVDRGSFTTFFTHTQNICYFLQAQVWHEQTETTIDRLSVSSSHVASKLEESYDLQNKMMKQQNKSMKTQEQILNNAANLSDIISQSSNNIHSMFEDFKKTTQEQRMLITDVFDRISKLQHMVLGEFSGFYSVIYYTLSIVVSYLLTSTSRTSSARFWLFGIMTVNMLAEQVLVPWYLGIFRNGDAEFESDEKTLYTHQRLFRKLSALAAVLVLAVCAYRYQDLATVNNQLLVEIRKQNSDLKKLMLGSSNLNSILNGKAVILGPEQAVADSTSMASSDSAVSSGASDSDGEESDHTFIIDKCHSESETDSWCTETLDTPTKSSLMSELHDLRQATPLREMSNHVESWIRTGYLNNQASGSRGKGSRCTTPDQFQNTSSERKQYFLRPRRPLLTSPDANPALQVESPKSFSRTVRQLEQLAYKNSILARAMIRRQILDDL